MSVKISDEFSPLPWRVDGCNIRDATGEVIASFNPWFSRARRNAELTVMAVNAQTKTTVRRVA